MTREEQRVVDVSHARLQVVNAYVFPTMQEVEISITGAIQYLYDGERTMERPGMNLDTIRRALIERWIDIDPHHDDPG